MSNLNRALKPSAVVALASAPKPGLSRSAARLAVPSDAAAPSPARQLQLKLEAAELDQPVGDDGVRWAPRATLLLSGGVSLLVWGAIAWAVGVHL